MTVYAMFDSPLGELLLVGEEAPSVPGGTALRSLSVPGQKRGAVVQDGWQHDPAAFAVVVAQLREYFAGQRGSFDLPLAVRGTEFQQRVWQALDAIEPGSTITYGQLAERVGASRAAVRAVGSAVGANPLLLVRPCHRVLGADGSLTGYAGGLERKEQLLRLEGSLPNS